MDYSVDVLEIPAFIETNRKLKQNQYLLKNNDSAIKFNSFSADILVRLFAVTAKIRAWTQIRPHFLFSAYLNKYFSHIIYQDQALLFYDISGLSFSLCLNSSLLFLKHTRSGSIFFFVLNFILSVFLSAQTYRG